MADTLKNDKVSLGIHKVYISQLLLVAAQLLVCVAGFAESNEVVLGVLALVIVGMTLVSVVLELIGLGKASPEDQGYQTAFALAIAALLLVVVQAVANIMGKTTNATYDDMIVKLDSIAICYFVIKTTISRLTAIGQEKLAAFGKNALLAVVVAYVAKLAVMIVEIFVKDSTVLNVLSILTSAMSLCGTCYYAQFLGKSWKLL